MADPKRCSVTVKSVLFLSMFRSHDSRGDPTPKKVANDWGAAPYASGAVICVGSPQISKNPLKTPKKFASGGACGGPLPPAAPAAGFSPHTAILLHHLGSGVRGKKFCLF